MAKDEHPPEMVDAMFLHGLIGRPSPNLPIPATLVTRLKENRLESSVAIPAPERPWSRPEWERIEAGHLSQEMDDKWHGYVEKDRLYLHRSWTGDRLSRLSSRAREGSSGSSRQLVRPMRGGPRCALKLTLSSSK